MITADLDVTGGQFGIRLSFQPISNLTPDEDHALGRNTASLVDQLRIGLRWPDDDLGEAVSVAEVDEDGAAMVALALDPAAQGDFDSDIFFAELSAGMGA